MASVLMVPAAAFGQEAQVFQTPEAAAEALLAAARSGDLDALFAILGAEWRDELEAGDPQALRQSLAEIAEGADRKVTLETEGDEAIILVGQRNWPLPIPISRGDAGWSFDTDAGLDEIFARRIGANELEAIDVCHSYIDAQAEYAAVDRDGDGVLEFAQRVVSTPGQKDGLFWPEGTGGTDEPSPFGPLVSEEADYLSGKAAGEPFHGYNFRVLSRQAANVPGGRYDYVINGNMIAGFAMVAVPADYGQSGIMTFLCSHHGDVWQRDLGEDTDLAAAAIQEMVLGEGWTVVDD
jgi:hypothetical protein